LLNIDFFSSLLDYEATYRERHQQSSDDEAGELLITLGRNAFKVIHALNSRPRPLLVAWTPSFSAELPSLAPTGTWWPG
jgi:hypothetical protein